MRPWQKVWREGFAPSLSDAVLEKLRDALLNNDVRLIQGYTTNPPAAKRTLDCPVEGACPIGFCCWMDEKLKTVREVHEFFATVCTDADSRLGEYAGCRRFLNWVDETPWTVVRDELLAEVKNTIEMRKEIAA